MREEAVAARLGQHTLARVDQDDRQVGGRGAGHHVARILLVPRRVGDDELALFGGEEAIGDVDRDPLLPLGGQPVDEQREIYILPLGSDTLAVRLQRRELILEDHRSEEHTSELPVTNAQLVCRLLLEKIKYTSIINLIIYYII